MSKNENKTKKDKSAPSQVQPSESAVMAEMIQTADALGNVHVMMVKMLKELEMNLKKISDQYQRELDGLATSAAGLKAELETAIGKSPELFASKKTMTCNGVRFGLRKANDEVVVYNEEAVINRIGLCLADKRDLLIRTRYELIIEGLKHLTPNDRAVIGVSIEFGMDRPYVKLGSSEIEKILNKMIEVKIKTYLKVLQEEP